MEEGKVVSSQQCSNLVGVTKGFGLHRLSKGAVEDQAEGAVELNVAECRLHSSMVLGPMSTKVGGINSSREVELHLSPAVEAVAVVLDLVSALSDRQFPNCTKLLQLKF